MESYHGIILTSQDAIVLLEAARHNLIFPVTRRLTMFERSTLITNGAVFVWNESGSKMRRWTDGKNWSASRVNGVFLTYKEMDSEKGLLKQSFTVMAKDGSKMHVVSYIDSNYSLADELKRPSRDKRFEGMVIEKDFYPGMMSEGLERGEKRCGEEETGDRSFKRVRMREEAIAPSAVLSTPESTPPLSTPPPISSPLMAIPLLSPPSPVLSSRKSSISSTSSSKSLNYSIGKINISLILPPLLPQKGCNYRPTKISVDFHTLISEDSRILSSLDRLFM